MIKQSNKEEVRRIHNLKIAKKSSWLNALFEEYGLNVKDKKQVLKRVLQKHFMQEVQSEKNSCI